MVKALLVLVFVGGVAMVTAQEPKNPPKKAPPKDTDFDVWVTFVREKTPERNEWSKEIPAKQYAVKDGVYYWHLGGYPVQGPVKGDKLIEEDGTVWVIEKKHGTGNDAVIAIKQPKKKP